MDEFGYTKQEIEKEMIIGCIMLDGETSYEEAEKQAIEEIKDIYSS